MSKAPKIPKEQRSFGGEKANLSGDSVDRRDKRTDVYDGQPGDAGINTAEQGRFGDIKQNTTHQGYQQDR
ncbi:hypothetical protein [uncultured Brevundimonas sp.]|uniref:hypothetical protein n=1 Tax=uncultured Brevundimonas sp. TaxID=213418 RepID=UPI0026377104|nr:hypothetical protein [uncultured Brevundimonas sp.]